METKILHGHYQGLQGSLQLELTNDEYINLEHKISEFIEEIP